MSQEDKRKRSEDLRRAIKARYERTGPKKRGPKPKEKIDYDSLPAAHQAKYWSADGRLQFTQMTGEKKIPQFIIDKAFELFCEGMTLETIAVKWDIKLSRVQNWAKSQSWQAKLDKFKEAIEENTTKAATKKAVSRRQEVDDRHDYIVRMMMAQIKWELESRPKPGADEKEQISFENRKLTRMKTLKVATDCYKVLIDTERTIVGLDKEEAKEHQLPSDFRFIIETSQGQSIENMDQLKAALPSQDPHKYVPGVPSEPLQLPEQTQSAAEVVIPVEVHQGASSSPGESRQNGGKLLLDPVTIAQKGAFAPTEASKPKLPTNPLGFLGMDIDFGGNF